jgi:hypothetical protein
MTNYPLRLPDHIMAEVRALATRSGTSLNQFLSTLIAERVGEMKALAHLEARAARADPDKALDVLSRVPDRRPQKADEL